MKQCITHGPICPDHVVGTCGLSCSTGCFSPHFQQAQASPDSTLLHKQINRVMKLDFNRLGPALYKVDMVSPIKCKK